MTSERPEKNPSEEAPAAGRDRSVLSTCWYRVVQWTAASIFSTYFGFRSSGRENLPSKGAAIVVSNHLSHLDVFVLGILLHRPLNYVARSTLFVPLIGSFIRSVGGFPIQREGLGASGMKETFRRLRAGGMVLLFPEGTRSPDGELGEIKPGIALLAKKTKVPIVPASVAGTFESWPRGRAYPTPHPLRVHYGRPISPEEIAEVSDAELTSLIRDRLLEIQRSARAGLARDLGRAT